MRGHGADRRCRRSATHIARSLDPPGHPDPAGRGAPGHSPEEDDMRHPASSWLYLVVVALAAFPWGSALPAAQRTFVASTGSDANPCTLTAPCRSFATAIANTSPNGEVIVKDTAGYGPVTITKSVSIVSPPGVYGGIA